MSEPQRDEGGSERERAPQHLQKAEEGKRLALRGKHAEALLCYRDAMRLAADSPGGDVFIRHYTTCVLESLEWMGAYEEAISHCQRVLSHYDAHPPSHPLARMDWASFCERLGVLLWKAEGPSSASAPLSRAVTLGKEAGRRFPLAEALLSWQARGYHVEPLRIIEEQRRFHYFVVREQALAGQGGEHGPE
jgi:tetratricopeptide (TPR) repeat protein